MMAAALTDGKRAEALVDGHEELGLASTKALGMQTEGES